MSPPIPHRIFRLGLLRVLWLATTVVTAFAAQEPSIQPGAASSATAPRLVRPRAVEQPDLVAGAPLEPLNAAQRAEWWAERSLGWENFAAGIAKGAVRTWWLTGPQAWGASWEGFGKRVGTRQAETFLSHGVEAALGAVWDEDPRYFRSGRQDAGGRLRHAVVSAFLAYDSRGNRKVALARGLGIVSAKLVSHSWRPEANWWQFSVEPLGTGFAGRITANLFREFMPDLKQKLFRRKNE